MTNAPVFPLLQEGLPPAPPEALGPYLDAASRCFARYGISRTTMPDIAREIGVSRTTVYRQVGSIDNLLWMMASRETHRLVQILPDATQPLSGPDALVKTLAAVVEQIRKNPVAIKVLSDEPDVVGPIMVSDLDRIIEQATLIVAPLLGASMQKGGIARRDPFTTANWLVRIAVSVVLSPPPCDLQDFLSEILVPALEVRPDLSCNSDHSINLVEPGAPQVALNGKASGSSNKP